MCFIQEALTPVIIFKMSVLIHTFAVISFEKCGNKSIQQINYSLKKKKKKKSLLEKDFHRIPCHCSPLQLSLLFSFRVYEIVQCIKMVSCGKFKMFEQEVRYIYTLMHLELIFEK